MAREQVRLKLGRYTRPSVSHGNLAPGDCATVSTAGLDADGNRRILRTILRCIVEQAEKRPFQTMPIDNTVELGQVRLDRNSMPTVLCLNTLDDAANETHELCALELKLERATVFQVGQVENLID